MCQHVVERHGRIDVLINCAGVIQIGPMEHMTVADYEEAMATHFWAPLRAIHEVVPVMRAQGEGRIVNISSIGGKIAPPHLGRPVDSRGPRWGLFRSVVIAVSSPPWRCGDRSDSPAP